MVAFFDTTALTDLDIFLTIMVGGGKSLRVEYQSTGFFDVNSIFIPVTSEIDDLLQDAIGQEEYLDMMKSLSISNPFRDTETIISKYA